MAWSLRGVRWGSAVVVAVLIATWALATAPGSSASQPTDIAITPVGVNDGEGDWLVGSRQPTIKVDVDFSGDGQGATEVRCGIADSQSSLPTYGPCGSRVTSSCSADQCWDYQPSFATDGMHTISVELVDSQGNYVDSLNQPFQVDTTPPQTLLLTPYPGIDQNVDINRKGAAVSFQDRIIDDDDPDQIIWEDNLQCALTTGQATPQWSESCDSLRVSVSTRVYRLWIRAVDPLGRPDPTPAESQPFSAEPCVGHLVGKPRSLRAIQAHGLRLRVRCIQPESFRAGFGLPEKELEALNLRYREISSSNLSQTASSHGSVAAGQTQTITVHLLRGIPDVLYSLHHLRIEIDTLSVQTDLAQVTLFTLP